MMHSNAIPARPSNRITAVRTPAALAPHLPDTAATGVTRARFPASRFISLLHFNPFYRFSLFYNQILPHNSHHNCDCNCN